MYVDPQRIYKCCPLWLDASVTRNGIREKVKRGFSVVVNDSTKGTSIRGQL